MNKKNNGILKFILFEPDDMRHPYDGVYNFSCNLCRQTWKLKMGNVLKGSYLHKE
jgi:hypothetical protein